MASKYDNVRADAYLAIAAGGTTDEVAARFGVPRSTVHDWAKAVAEKMGKAPAEIRENNFDDAVQAAAVQLMATLTSQMKLAGDQHWLMSMTAKESGTHDVIQFTKAITERFTLVVQFAQGVAPERQSLEQSNTVEAEIVDA